LDGHAWHYSTTLPLVIAHLLYRSLATLQDEDEVEHYFNYMGLLASEGTYDRMNLLKSMHIPAHVILLLASQENDDPKVCICLLNGHDGVEYCHLQSRAEKLCKAEPSHAGGTAVKLLPS